MRAIAVTSDGGFAVSGSADNTIIVWDLNEKKLEALWQGHLSPLTHIQILRGDRYMVTSSADGAVRIWSLRGKSHKVLLRGHSSAVFALVVTRDNRYIVTGSKDKTICVWDTRGRLQEAGVAGQKYHGPGWHHCDETIEGLDFEEEWMGILIFREL